MRRRLRSYECAPCQWQGRLEPVEPGAGAPCPNCGVTLYPLSWGQTWGVALMLIMAVVSFVFIAAFVANR